jgi:hypothetical protein
MRPDSSGFVLKKEFLFEQCCREDSLDRSLSNPSVLPVTIRQQVRNILQLFSKVRNASAYGSVFVSAQWILQLRSLNSLLL